MMGAKKQTESVARLLGQRSWDCDLPDEPHLRVQYWRNKEAFAAAHAATLPDAEAEIWQSFALAWKEAAESVGHLPGHPGKRIGKHPLR